MMSDTKNYKNKPSHKSHRVKVRKYDTNFRTHCKQKGEGWSQLVAMTRRRMYMTISTT